MHNQKFHIYGSAYRLIKDTELAKKYILLIHLGVKYNLKLRTAEMAKRKNDQRRPDIKSRRSKLERYGSTS